MKIVTAAEMRRIDQVTTERYGVPSLTLMENAGRGVLEFLRERYGPLDRQKIAVLCGGGNNGGDGLVAARLLKGEGLKPSIVLLAKPEALKGDAAVNYSRLLESGAAPEVAADLETWRRIKPRLAGTSLLVDALLGTGVSRPVEGFLLEVVREVNSNFFGARVIAVDLPSGLSADTGEVLGPCIRADASVTFTAPKRAHIFPPACELTGDWVVKQIGTPPEAVENDPTLFLNLTCAGELQWLAEPRPATAHKGNFGHVLLVAGSVGKTGAAALAAKAALRAGAGLVTVATPRSALPVVAALGMEFMTEPLPETDAGTISLRALDYGLMEKLMEGKAVVAIGPGLGTVPETSEFVRTVVNRCALPLVLDADGLNAFAGCVTTLKVDGRPQEATVLTPHPGEMARLLGMKSSEVQERRVETAKEFSARLKLHLVLKGFRTLIAAPNGQVWVNPTGNPGMATGGTGDVLTGIIAGILAQHPARPVSQAVTGAVYLHGLAGDLAARRRGEGPMIAGDLIEELPEAFRALRGGRPR